MKKSMGAQTASEGRTESRFATLTAGLLARKGQAAPSNSPVADPADETEAYTLTEDLIQRSPKAAKAVADMEEAVEEAARQAEQPLAAEAKKPAAKPARKQDAPAEEETLTPSIKVINERSAEAGYPQNPTPEEIAAMEMEAEADAVSSYLDDFAGDFEDDDLDFSDADYDAQSEGAASLPSGRVVQMPQPAAGPWARQSVPAVAADAKTARRASVTFRMTARDFLRLKLGAAELDMTASDIILDALEDYLDARGVESFAGCECLQKAIRSCEKSCGSAAFEDD
ncbi:MAG: hypothetical protein R3C51_00955 [Parvularculaceae bacterium]